MSIYMKDTVIDSCPAYDTVKREPTREGYINLVAGSALVMYGALHKYKVGTAASSALAYNECPIESYNREKERGHKMYWINSLPYSLSNTKQERKTYLLVDLESVYRLEGKLFKIIHAPNDNLDFVEQEEV